MTEAIRATLEKARDLLEWSRDNFQMDHADAVLLVEAIDEINAALDAGLPTAADVCGLFKPET